MLKDFAISIIQTLRQQGFQAYLAGGCVRDLLLKREPCGLRCGDQRNACASNGDVS